MNKTPSEIASYIPELKSLIGDADEKVFVGVCPAQIALATAADAAKNSGILIGAQNMNENDKGPLTGEISALMLLDAGVKFSLIGHSERRGVFGESDETVNKKLLKTLQSGLIAVLCIGETLIERTQGKTEDVLKYQLTKALEGIYSNEFRSIIIAYEPVWAISKGVGSLPTPTNDDIEKVVAYIRFLLESCYDKKTATETAVLYGGSVDDVNANTIVKANGVDGALVGGASLDVNKFAGVVKIFAK
ncbi:triosephosphate isomerase [Holotrichia oblita]|nr:triosephosphate isomerase [Holotrichia oblita]